MKKLILSFLLSLFLISNAFAAWTVDITIDSTVNGEWQRVTIVAVSDGSDPAEFELDTSTLNTYLSTTQMKRLKGALLWQIETVPGTGDAAPTGTWTVSFDSGAGASILDLTGLSTSVAELHEAAATLGFEFNMFDNLGIDIGDIGDADDSVTIHLIFLK